MSKFQPPEIDDRFMNRFVTLEGIKGFLLGKTLEAVYQASILPTIEDYFLEAAVSVNALFLRATREFELKPHELRRIVVQYVVPDEKIVKELEEAFKDSYVLYKCGDYLLQGSFCAVPYAACSEKEYAKKKGDSRRTNATPEQYLHILAQRLGTEFTPPDKHGLVHSKDDFAFAMRITQIIPEEPPAEA